MWNNQILLGMAAVLTIVTSTSIQASDSKDTWKETGAKFCREVESFCNRSLDEVNNPVKNEHPGITTVCRDIAKTCAEKLEREDKEDKPTSK